METASNLVWLCLAGIVFAITLAGLRRDAGHRSANGTGTASHKSALTTAALLCLLLLPVVSLTDDKLDNRQAPLPLAAQAWHLASEGGALGLEAVSLLSACFLLLTWAFAPKPLSARQIGWNSRPNAVWLMRAQRLRPPPAPGSVPVPQPRFAV